MLWKRKLLIVLVWLVIVAPAIYVIRRMPDLYKADALIVVDSQKIPERYVAATVVTDANERLAAISHEIMSTPRLLKIIETFDLYREERKKKVQDEILDQMRKDIGTKLEKGWTGGSAGAFRIEYQGKDPVLVAKVADRLANLYVEENVRTREVQAGDTAQFIDNQLAIAKKTLDDQEAKVAAFKQQHMGVLPEQENALLSTLSGLQVELQGNQDAVNRSQQSLMLLNTSISAAEMSEAAIARSLQPRVTSSGVVVTQSGKPEKKPSEELQSRLEMMTLRYTPNHPDVVALREEVARLRQIEQAEAAATPRVKAPDTKDSAKDDPQPPIVTRELLQERERVATLKTQLGALKKDLEFREQERQRILAAIQACQSRIDKLPTVEQDMAALTRDYENSKNNYKSLLDKKLAAGMASDMERRQQSERFTIVDPPRVPQRPFKPNRIVLMLAAVFGSLVVGVVTGLATEFPKNVLLGEWELPPDTIILGRVPNIRMSQTGSAAPLNPSRLTALSSVLLAAMATYFKSNGA